MESPSCVSADADHWAQDVLMAVRDLDQEQLSLELKPVLDLASEYSGLAHNAYGHSA